jgi:hypothetical protein
MRQNRQSLETSWWRSDERSIANSHGNRQLFPLVIDELRRLAARKLAHESPGPTPAALGITVYLARQNWTDARACLGDVLGG